MKKAYKKPELKIIDLRENFAIFSNGCGSSANDDDSCFSGG